MPIVFRIGGHWFTVSVLCLCLHSILPSATVVFLHVLQWPAALHTLFSVCNTGLQTCVIHREQRGTLASLTYCCLLAYSNYYLLY
ncbi:hypothetical protein B0H14DRAFT_2718757 [Mycena olivaceomarginata]|nr:hypothetical protein B0H14DRAFT_2718757 [Mycena olivaceomarginata]